MTPSLKVENGNNHHKHFMTKLIEKLNRYSYGTLFQIWAGMALFFAIAYFGFSYINGGGHGPTGFSNMDVYHRIVNAIYYSVITATSTGYGDITPMGFSKVLAALQSISALFVFAVFVTKLVSHQQDVTLNEVHRLTFEDVFHNTREGLYICRKDFDAMIEEAEETGVLKPESWENLETAYRQMQTLIEEIPDFYENEIHKYTIDKKREQLLMESVHRSLHRINQMIDIFSIKEISWVDNTRSMVELRELVKTINAVAPLWKERSPYQAIEAFEDIIQLKEKMHERIKASIPME